MFLLFDCNNFYATAETVFRPDLAGRPIIVLSNNDGCVVSRSKEAKAIGIKMGVPAFQIKEEIKKHGIILFSSNYALYGDMSSRVMSVIGDMMSEIEIYSIDECFAFMGGCEKSVDLTKLGLNARERVLKCTGITVCCGIARTKTLAKLANHAAKKWSATGGVLELTDPLRIKKLLALVKVEDIWGIGRQLTKQLNELGIFTGLDFANMEAKKVRTLFSVVLERTHREINGESCIALEDAPPTKKQIVCSRAFGKRILLKHDMSQAVAEHVIRACIKLRKEKQKAKALTVFITTGSFPNNEDRYSQSRTAELTLPSNDTRDFLHLAMLLLNVIWRDGYKFAKCGVMLLDFFEQNHVQGDLFSSPLTDNKLMSVIDQINSSGVGTVTFGSSIGLSAHAMKRERLSPAYTTNINMIPIVK